MSPNKTTVAALILERRITCQDSCPYCTCSEPNQLITTDPIHYNDSNYLSSTQKCKACTATGGNIRKLLSGECNAYGHSAELLKMLLEKLNNREAGEKNRLEIIREKVRAALKAATEAKQRAFNLGETSFQYNKGRIEMAQELLNLFF